MENNILYILFEKCVINVIVPWSWNAAIQHVQGLSMKATWLTPPGIKDFLPVLSQPYYCSSSNLYEQCLLLPEHSSSSSLTGKCLPIPVITTNDIKLPLLSGLPVTFCSCSSATAVSPCHLSYHQLTKHTRRNSLPHYCFHSAWHWAFHIISDLWINGVKIHRHVSLNCLSPENKFIWVFQVYITRTFIRKQSLIWEMSISGKLERRWSRFRSQQGTWKTGFRANTWSRKSLP